LKRALIQLSNEIRHWVVFDAEALREANGALSLYERRLADELHDGEDGGDSSP
jgi:hypothetical protein